MKSKIYDDERDHEIGGLYYSGPDPSGRESDDDECDDAPYDDVDDAYGDAHDDEDGADDLNDVCDDDDEYGICVDADDEYIGISQEVLTPTTVWADPVTVGYAISWLAGLIAELWNFTRQGQTALFLEGLAHMSRGGVLGAWTPRDGTPPEPTGVFSNSLIEVDALSLGRLLARGRDKCSVVWIDGFHAIHFESGIAILDTEDRLHCWLPYAR